MANKKTTIAIIGAGASGTILANQLVEKRYGNSSKGFSIFLIEKSGNFGPGLAYSTPLASHILNMRAETLGISDNNPGHFAEWLKEQKTSFPDDSISSIDPAYPSRKVYGEYIKDVLESTLNRASSMNSDVELIKGEAVDIIHKGDVIDILLADGCIISSDYTILSPGNFSSAFLDELKGVKGYIPYPWPAARILETVPREDPVCILGTGLSAIDTLFTLLENDHKGEITFLSRRGFLPKVQGDFNNYQLKYINPEAIDMIIKKNGSTLPLDIVKNLLFKEIENAEGKNIDWLRVFNPDGTVSDILEKDIKKAEHGIIPYQRVLNASGPLTGMIWKHFSVDDRSRFDRELKTLWTVYRHPMPLVNARKIDSAIKSGQLDIESGCMCVRTCSDKGFEIDVSTRFGVPYVIKTPFIINATGQGLDVSKFDSDLIKRLVKRELIVPHPNGGIHVDFESSMVLDRKGEIIPGLFALGEITRGVHFFTNGIVPNMKTSDRIADYIIADAEERG
ncbi:FAD/NAD(P)-binding protein [Thermodesulfobacteriota bacterium]